MGRSVFDEMMCRLHDMNGSMQRLHDSVAAMTAAFKIIEPAEDFFEHCSGHEWRLISPAGDICPIHTPPVIDRSGKVSAIDRLVPGHRYRCQHCREIITIDDDTCIVVNIGERAA